MQSISRDPTKKTTWRLEPPSAEPPPRQVFMRDVTWTKTRARGTVTTSAVPTLVWTKVFWTQQGFGITKSAYARFDPDGSAWYA